MGALGVKRSAGREDGVRREGVCLCREFGVCVCVLVCVCVSACMFNFIPLEINIFIKHACSTPLTEAFLSIQRPQY